MIDEIENILQAGFEKELFSAALKNVQENDSPIRLNNFSYATRELTRHVLYRLAPDENVINCSWYKNETDKKNGITRKQRSYYAVQGGLSDTYIKNTLEIEVDEIHSKLIRSINRLSKFTHIEPESFNLPTNDVDSFVRKIIEAFYEFFVLINDCRKSITDSLWEQIDSAIVDEALRETIQALDELASHHYIDEIYTDKVVIYSIDHESIMFCAKGVIGCELQWGSNSDIRKGDGAIMSKSFPFSCKLISPVDEPDAVESVEESLGVDTSSWTGVRYGQDEQAKSQSKGI